MTYRWNMLVYQQMVVKRRNGWGNLSGFNNTAFDENLSDRVLTRCLHSKNQSIGIAAVHLEMTVLSKTLARWGGLAPRF